MSGMHAGLPPERCLRLYPGFIFPQFFIFMRSLDPLARQPQKGLEAETLQKVAKSRVDLQKIIADQNELRGSAQSSLKDHFCHAQVRTDVAAFALHPNYSISLTC